MKALVLVFPLAYAMTLVGCQAMPYEPYARSVKVQPKNGGIVAVRVNHRPEDKQRAIAMMAETCGSKKPEVTEEGEVVTGQKTMTDNNNYQHSTPTTSGIYFGPAVSSSSNSVTTQEKEWQMTYKCL